MPTQNEKVKCTTSYGALASWQVQPLWSDFWTPLQWLGLVEPLERCPEVRPQRLHLPGCEGAIGCGAFHLLVLGGHAGGGRGRRLLRRAVRRADPAAARRLSGHRDA